MPALWKKERLLLDLGASAIFSWLVLFVMALVFAPLGLALLLIFVASPSNLGALGGFLLCLYATASAVISAIVKWRHSPAEIEARIRDISPPLHPDPDVDALLRKEIDLLEYGRRKSAIEVRSNNAPHSVAGSTSVSEQPSLARAGGRGR